MRNVHKLALENARRTAGFANADSDLLITVVRQAAIWHDLGKLDPKNQAVLAGKEKAKSLPVQHTEAGTVHLRESNILSALLVRSHHIGLPDMIEESNRGDLFFRDKDEQTRLCVEQSLDELVRIHDHVLKQHGLTGKNEHIATGVAGDKCVFLRLALSCLVDADHEDTALHYQRESRSKKPVPLRASERLQQLDRYVKTLAAESNNAGDHGRNQLRQQMYEKCRAAQPEAMIVSCDSPVGSGKTTAVMAHLLKRANQLGLRGIIVVLPFTNIIRQSVEVYRKSIVLEGENPEEVVAELHHQADFENPDTRYLTALWKAPIVVTTAVNFFETLSSNSTGTLRKLHQLPGRAVFVDESHAALPVKLMPLAWHWMNVLAEDWRCYWLLASGSQSEYWKLDSFSGKWPRKVPQLVDRGLRKELAVHESNRISYRFKEEPMGTEELAGFLEDLEGPVLCIVNTVQSAAVIAQQCRSQWGRARVEHLSTALTPEHREIVLDRIKARLGNPDDSRWILVATSCVEAGVDLSFKTGVRELASLNSLLQTSGRVNRGSAERYAEVWTVTLNHNGMLKEHPMLEDSGWVLRKLFEDQTIDEISSELCTKALELEIKRSGKVIEEITQEEYAKNFPEVEKKFRVINTDTRLVIVDERLVQRMESREKVHWNALQRKSVQLWGYRIEALGLEQIRGHEKIFKLGGYEYDKFIGYMKGVLKTESFRINGGAVI